MSAFMSAVCMWAWATGIAIGINVGIIAITGITGITAGSATGTMAIVIATGADRLSLLRAPG